MGAPAAANRLVREVVDYVGDPLGDATAASIAGEYARGMQGLTGIAYAGDKGDPQHSYTGPFLVPLQQFTGQAAILAASTYRTTPTIDTGLVTGPESAPVYRLLADKLRNDT